MIDLQFLRQVEADIHEIPTEDFSYVASDKRTSHQDKVRKLLERATERLDPADSKRCWAEFMGFGPLESLMANEEITEIMVNGPQSIWIEKNGRIERVADSFCSDLSFRNSLERLCESSRSQITIERPSAQGFLKGFRVQIVGAELTRGSSSLCLRRHPDNPWTLDKLETRGWSSEREIQILHRWISTGKNFIVVGPTGSGKTSVVNACLQTVRDNERVLILEDTQELCLPNQASQRLLTREDPQRILPDISLSDLVRQSLRLRPDRLVIGEIRGGEAKDFLLALSTGHNGSFGTLHAATPQQALIRLEMLIQMGAPNWNLQAIRRLIQLSLKGIVVVGRSAEGRRVLNGLYEISSLEESGFLVEQVQA